MAAYPFPECSTSTAILDLAWLADEDAPASTSASRCFWIDKYIQAEGKCSSSGMWICL